MRKSHQSWDQRYICIRRIGSSQWWRAVIGHEPGLCVFDGGSTKWGLRPPLCDWWSATRLLVDKWSTTASNKMSFLQNARLFTRGPFFSLRCTRFAHVLNIFETLWEMQKLNSSYFCQTMMPWLNIKPSSWFANFGTKISAYFFCGTIYEGFEALCCKRKTLHLKPDLLLLLWLFSEITA